MFHCQTQPHNGGKKANMLFIDGQIVGDDPQKLNNVNLNWIVDFRLPVGSASSPF